MLREGQPWDDDPWDVFIPDDDQRDPLPEHGDFWTHEDDPSGDEADIVPAYRQHLPRGLR